MLDVLGLSGLQKVTARLIEGIEVKQVRAGCGSCKCCTATQGAASRTMSAVQHCVVRAWWCRLLLDLKASAAIVNDTTVPIAHGRDIPPVAVAGAGLVVHCDSGTVNANVTPQWHISHSACPALFLHDLPGCLRRHRPVISS